MKQKHNKGPLGSIERLILLSVLFCVVSNWGCENKVKTTHDTLIHHDPVPVIKEKWHWDSTTKQSESAGYAQVVKVGNTVYVSGVPTDDLSPEGVTKLYNTLELCLKAFGATPHNIVKETLYTTDIEEMKKLNPVRKKFYQGDYPAATWVQISRLFEPSAKLEVDVIAELTDEKN